MKSGKILILIFVLLCLPLAASAQLTNLLTGNISGFGLNPNTNWTMVLQILTPKNRYIGGQYIADDPLSSVSDMNGNFAFTNVQVGLYYLSASTANTGAGSHWQVLVLPNNTGIIQLTTLIPLSPLQYTQLTNYFTTAQATILVQESLILFGVNPIAAGSGITITKSGAPFATNVISSVGSATNLSPWTYDINGAGHSLTAVNNLQLTGALTNSVIGISGPLAGDNYPMLQAAINSFSITNTSFPQGGEIDLGPGVYHISQPITLNVGFPTNFALTIKGAGSLNTAIIQDTSNNVILVTGSQPNGAGIRLFNVTIGESTNACVGLVDLVGGVSTITMDDVNLVWWTAWTNQTLGGPNYYKTGCTLTNNLVGVMGTASDLSVFHNCGSFGLACAIDESGFDHVAVDYGRFYFSPSAFTPSQGPSSPHIVTNSWPVGSPYRNGAAIVCTGVGDGNTDRTHFHNHFFGCNAAFLIDLYAPGYQGRPLVSMHDQFEDESAAVLCTPGSVFSLEDPQIQSPIAAPFSKIVHEPFANTDPNAYAVEDVGEPGRTGNFKSFWQRLNMDGTAVIGGLSVLPVIPTNVSGIILTNGDLPAANVLFTNPVAGHAAGTVLFTNAAFGGGILFDPNLTVQADRFDVYLSGTDYGGFDPWGTWPVNPNYLQAPGNAYYPWSSFQGAMQFNGQTWFILGGNLQDWAINYPPDAKLIYTNVTPAWQVTVTNGNISVGPPVNYPPGWGVATPSVMVSNASGWVTMTNGTVTGVNLNSSNLLTTNLTMLSANNFASINFTVVAGGGPGTFSGAETFGVSTVTFPGLNLSAQSIALPNSGPTIIDSSGDVISPNGAQFTGNASGLTNYQPSFATNGFITSNGVQVVQMTTNGPVLSSNGFTAGPLSSSVFYNGGTTNQILTNSAFVNPTSGVRESVTNGTAVGNGWPNTSANDLWHMFLIPLAYQGGLFFTNPGGGFFSLGYNPNHSGEGGLDSEGGMYGGGSIVIKPGGNAGGVGGAVLNDAELQIGDIGDARVNLTLNPDHYPNQWGSSGAPITASSNTLGSSIPIMLDFQAGVGYFGGYVSNIDLIVQAWASDTNGNGYLGFWATNKDARVPNAPNTNFYWAYSVPNVAIFAGPTNNGIQITNGYVKCTNYMDLSGNRMMWEDTVGKQYMQMADSDVANVFSINTLQNGLVAVGGGSAFAELLVGTGGTPYLWGGPGLGYFAVANGGLTIGLQQAPVAGYQLDVEGKSYFNGPAVHPGVANGGTSATNQLTIGTNTSWSGYIAATNILAIVETSSIPVLAVSTNGNVYASGTITGNGFAGMTNSTGLNTNWVIGAINTNSSGRAWLVGSDAALTPAAVVGAVNMRLEVSNGNGSGRTNTVGFSTTALSIVMLYTNQVSGVVPSGYGFTFTNRSGGAGNSSALVPASGTLLDY
jgi:hypothetical protein